MTQKDKRKPLLNLLNSHKTFDQKERRSLQKIIDFVEENEQCFENDFKLGHITGSALVVDRNLEYVLLTHHAKLDKWLQFGGHSDGHGNVAETAFREAQEESGPSSLKFYTGISGIFDVDVHLIPERGEMPAHNHNDVRFLLIGGKNQPFVVSNESKDLRWIKLDEVNKYNSQPEFLRMIRKVVALKKTE